MFIALVIAVFVRQHCYFYTTELFVHLQNMYLAAKFFFHAWCKLNLSSIMACLCSASYSDPLYKSRTFASSHELSTPTMETWIRFEPLFLLPPLKNPQTSALVRGRGFSPSIVKGCMRLTRADFDIIWTTAVNRSLNLKVQAFGKSLRVLRFSLPYILKQTH